MEAEQIRALAERFIQALSRLEHDGMDALDELAELFAEDARLTNPALEMAGEERVGRDGVRRFWKTYHDVLGVAESRFSHVTVGDDAAGLFWTTHARGRGRHGLDYDGVTLLELDERGLIRYLRAYFDLDVLAHAIRRDLEAEPVPSTQREQQLA